MSLPSNSLGFENNEESTFKKVLERHDKRPINFFFARAQPHALAHQPDERCNPQAVLRYTSIEIPK